MITMKSTGPKSFLVYKTHLPFIGGDHSIILKNTFSDFEKELPFYTTELHNSYKFEIDDTDLTAIAGQNTLLVKDASGATIYTEEVRVLE